MEIPLIVENNKYSVLTYVRWQLGWCAILDMCYHKKNIKESILITPDKYVVEGEQKENSSRTDHCEYYEKNIPMNSDEIIFDYMWKQYSKEAGPDFEIHVIPEFKNLYVPKCLFYNIGIGPLFRHCFPNCTIIYWED